MCVCVCIWPCRIAVSPPGLAREDWKVVRALAEVRKHITCQGVEWKGGCGLFTAFLYQYKTYETLHTCGQFCCYTIVIQISTSIHAITLLFIYLYVDVFSNSQVQHSGGSERKTARDRSSSYSL